MRVLQRAVISFVLLVGSLPLAFGQTFPSNAGPFQLETIAEGLEHPWMPGVSARRLGSGHRAARKITNNPEQLVGGEGYSWCARGGRIRPGRVI